MTIYDYIVIINYVYIIIYIKMKKTFNNLADIENFLKNQDPEIKEIVIEDIMDDIFELQLKDLKHIEKIVLINYEQCYDDDNKFYIKNNKNLKEIILQGNIEFNTIVLENNEILENIILDDIFCQNEQGDYSYININNIEIKNNHILNIYLDEFAKKVINFDCENMDNLNFIVSPIKPWFVIPKIGYLYDVPYDTEILISLEKVDKYFLLMLYLETKWEYWFKKTQEDEYDLFYKKIFMHLEKRLLDKQYQSENQIDILLEYFKYWDTSFEALKQYIPQILIEDIQNDLNIENIAWKYDYIWWKIHYNYEEIEWVDTKTFEVFESYNYVSPYSKDKNNIYFKNKVFKKADYNTFELFLFPFLWLEFYCFDKKNIYNEKGKTVTKIHWKSIKNVDLSLWMESLIPMFYQHHEKIKKLYAAKIEDNSDDTNNNDDWFSLLWNMFSNVLENSKDISDAEELESELDKFSDALDFLRAEKSEREFLDYMRDFQSEFKTFEK